MGLPKLTFYAAVAVTLAGALVVYAVDRLADFIEDAEVGW
jgi:hypothetical protein